MTSTSSREACVLLTLLAIFAASAHAAAPQTVGGTAAMVEDLDLIDADRPGIADGSRVIGPGHVQIETGLQREFSDEERTQFRTSSLPTLVRVGLGRRLEARVESNVHVWTRSSDASGSMETAAWAPTSFGVKYQIANRGQRTFGAIVRVFPSSGSGERRTSRTTGDLRLAADFDLTPRVSVNPNIGVARYEGGGGRAFTAALMAVTVSYAPSDRLSPFVDAAFQRPVDVGGDAALILDAGLGYIVSRNVQADFSLGTAARGPGPSSFVSFGLSLRRPR